jgi:hypothetical protein
MLPQQTKKFLDFIDGKESEDGFACTGQLCFSVSKR